jgi:GNAT superfamily N-acetyltransferase
VIEIRRATGVDWQRLRAVRLRALLDAPDAFESTYEREVGLEDRAWQARATQAAQVLAIEGETTVGLAVGMPSPAIDAREWLLVSMWVSAHLRGQGIAQRLIQTVVDLAREHGSTRLRLSVVESNERARRAYLSFGFMPAGAPYPMERYPTLIEQDFILDLS